LVGLLVGGALGAGCGNLDHGRDQSAKSGCYTCHRVDYESTEDPPHDEAFPTECWVCHETDTWDRTHFDHPYALTGAHEGADCLGCHTGEPPQWIGLPTACVGCHREDYDSSLYPGHQTFSTTCTHCHSTDAWVPAVGASHPDDQFRISSGAHANIACLDCHDVGLGSSVGGMNTDCVGCHTGVHSRSRMDSEHDGVSGYPTGPAPPNFCLECHPHGR